MIKNDLGVATNISTKLARNGSLNFSPNPTISYSSSNAMTGLQSCLSEANEVVQLLSANIQADSQNIQKIGMALHQADQAARQIGDSLGIK